jgi:PPK2 family polyphosphate:nucleotide phosphotransferase
MGYGFDIKPGSKVRLSDFDPDFTGKLGKSAGKDKIKEIAKELTGLQELMYVAKQHSLLAVFQGRDTAGKDGAINEVLSYVNVQSCRATYFKVPTAEELAHDFLWRVHSQVPGKGGITLFNRSHYEDVLVVRVHNLVPMDVWQKRFDQINEFERLLVDSNTILLKFYLHISKDEQEKRLLDREKVPSKAWKLGANDWKERALWDQYSVAYEDALAKCNTKDAPWLVVPANHNWYRDLTIAESIAAALRPYKDQWTAKLAEIGTEAKQDLAAYRESLKQPSK